MDGLLRAKPGAIFWKPMVVCLLVALGFSCCCLVLLVAVNLGTMALDLKAAWFKKLRFWPDVFC